MARCPNCKHWQDGGRICDRCGLRIELPPRADEAVEDEAIRRCAQCGILTPKLRCPGCGLPTRERSQ